MNLCMPAAADDFSVTAEKVGEIPNILDVFTGGEQKSFSYMFLGSGFGVLDENRKIKVVDVYGESHIDKLYDRDFTLKGMNERIHSGNYELLSSPDTGILAKKVSANGKKEIEVYNLLDGKVLLDTRQQTALRLFPQGCCHMIFQFKKYTQSVHFFPQWDHFLPVHRFRVCARSDMPRRLRARVSRPSWTTRFRGARPMTSSGPPAFRKYPSAYR